MRKSNFNPQHKAYKINCSAPPQIICRVLNGILLTGKAHIQEKSSKMWLWDWGIASLAYGYRRTKINFKWIQQLKWGPGKSCWEKEGIFYLPPIEHSSRSQFIPHHTICKRTVKEQQQPDVGHLQLFPICPSPEFGTGSKADWEMAFTQHITRARWRGVTPQGRQGEKPGLLGLLAAGQGQ